MKSRMTIPYLTSAAVMLSFLAGGPLFAEDSPPDQPQFLSLGNQTFIQINNILIPGGKVNLKLNEDTYASVGKLVVLDSVAEFLNSPEDTSIAENAPPSEDVVVLTRYDSEHEITRTTVTIAPLQVVAEETVADDQPSPMTDFTTDDMFGTRGGYIHPFVSLHGEYTDNVYNLNTGEQSNYMTVISPGIWAGVPRTKEQPISISTHNASIGGMRYAMAGNGAYTRFQAYLLAGMDYKTYSVSNDLDHSAWRVEGMYQQNLPVGISIRMAERYGKDRDRFDRGSFLPADLSGDQNGTPLTATPTLLRDYSSNLALLSLNLDMSERFSGQVDYSNFLVNYDEEQDNWLDRNDNTFAVTMTYNHSPKTSVFIQYEHAVVSYDVAEGNDGASTNVSGGVRWKSTAKTALMIKGGYQNREYSASGEGSQGTFSMEGNLDYLITDKTKIGFKLYKGIEETNNTAYRGKDTTAAQLTYSQHFSDKLQGFVKFLHETSDYNGFQVEEAYLPDRKPRKDVRFMVRPGVQYRFKDWLNAELAYSFEDRNSTNDTYDFSSQTVFLGLNAAF